MAARDTQLGCWLGLETREGLLTIGASPAIERAARELVEPTIRELDRLAGQLADEVPPFRRTQAWVGGLGNQFVAKQRQRFGGIDRWIGAHVHLQVASKGMAPSNSSPTGAARAHSCWS